MSKKAAIGPGLIGLFVVAQLVPYGRHHTNPPVTGSPGWDSPRTEELARRACFDCHSNETKWPVYASIAPMSWRVQSHVDEARSKLNFSAFDRPQEEADEAAKEVRSRGMPPWDYLLLHPRARLNVAERDELVRGLQATLGTGEPESQLSESDEDADEGSAEF